MRVDAFIWMVRIYKSRSIASNMVKSGKVLVNSEKVKPSKEVKLGDRIVCKVGDLNKEIEIKDFPKSRVGAKLVSDYIVDLTSEEELNRVQDLKMMQIPMKGYDGRGRPTKKVRRDLDQFKGE